MNDLVEELLLLARLDEGRPLEHGDRRPVRAARRSDRHGPHGRARLPDLAQRWLRVVTDHRRCRPPPPGDRQPPRQRANAHAAGHEHRDRSEHRRQRGRDHGQRQRAGNGAGASQLACSNASTAPIRRDRVRPVAAASACRSCTRSCRHTAARCESTRRRVRVPRHRDAPAVGNAARGWSRARRERCLVVPEPRHGDRRDGARRRGARVRVLLLVAQHRRSPTARRGGSICTTGSVVWRSPSRPPTSWPCTSTRTPESVCWPCWFPERRTIRPGPSRGA